MNLPKVIEWRPPQRLAVLRHFVVFAAAVGGIAVKYGGTLFLGDVLGFPLLAVLLVFGDDARAKRKAIIFLSLTLVYIGAFVLSDVINNSSYFDLLRGLSRNVIFVVYCYIGLRITRLFGFHFCALVVGIFCGSYALSMALGLGPPSMLPFRSFSDYLKFHGLFQFSVIAILAIARNWRLLLVPVLSVLGVGVLVVSDFRSGALLAILPLLVWAYVLARRRFGRRLIDVAGLLLVVSVLTSANQFLLNREYFADETVDRRQESNRIRDEMVAFSIDQFLQHPVFGTGSWSFVTNFSSERDEYAQSGVHNFWLQYANEYGIFGLLFSIGATLSCGIGVIRIVHHWTNSPLPTTGRILLPIFVCAYVLDQLLLGGVLGFGRIAIGVSLGMAIGCADAPDFLRYRVCPTGRIRRR